MASTSAAADQYSTNMPLTPRDSDNDDPGDPAPMAGRKRTASEMDDGSKFRDATDGDEADAPDVPETIEAEVSPDFTITCPAHTKRARSAKGDVYFELDEPVLAPQLSIDFAVRPGKKWAELLRFKNAKFKDPFVVVYSAGQIVYVNRHSPVPPSPAADASVDERLTYDKENFWVGLISEFRAENQEKVYVRVFWLYWPEELPMGRQPYHGKNELVLSNHVDIIEAQTIASHAEISHWDENDDSNKVVLQERYWRQTYDLKKMDGDARNALSKLRKFCICGGYDNPGVDMYQCHTVKCGIWNHEACLIRDLEERAWAKFRSGTLSHEGDAKENEKSFTQKVGETVGHIVKLGFAKDDPTRIPPSKPTPVGRGNKKLKAASAGQKPWTGKLEAKIVKVQKGEDEETHYATVTQLVPSPDAKATTGFEPKTWHMKMICLKCHQPLDGTS